MNKVLEWIEVFVDKSIPYLIGVLIVIVIIDFFAMDVAAKYATLLTVADYVIITFFVADLIFKYNRVRNIPDFIKKYWLDIIAVFPFVLVFRLVVEPAVLYEEIANGVKNLFHTGVVLEEATTVTTTALKAPEVVRTAETIAKEETAAKLISEESRFARLEKLIKPAERAPELTKALGFYEHPKKKRRV